MIHEWYRASIPECLGAVPGGLVQSRTGLGDSNCVSSPCRWRVVGQVTSTTIC